MPLPERKAETMVEALKALADPTRLQIVAILEQSTDPICICDLTATFDLSQPTISHHMAKLKEAGLVEATKKGLWSYYRIKSDLDGQTRRLLEALL
jgi:ArsR family transcriptional regulator